MTTTQLPTTTQPQLSTASASTVATQSTSSISEILQSAIDSKSCFGISCKDGQSCYIDPPNLIHCANDSTIPSPPPTHWRLNATTFPPIEYMGDRIGTSEGHSCETLGGFQEAIALWVESFAFAHWAPNDERNSYPAPPQGSFLNALSFIGSCIDNFSDQNQTRFYCSEDNTCKSKLLGGDACQSSNQCASAQCGSLLLSPGFLGNGTNSTCNDSFSALDYLTANRTRPPNVAIHLSQPPSGLAGADSGGTTSGGQAAVVAVCIIIIVVSLALIAYSRRLFKKHDALGDNGRGGAFLNRNNSVTSLPPYRVVDDNQSLGLMASINHWFSPPGELPPPYEVVDSRLEVRVDNNNTSNDNDHNDNNSSDPATIQDVRGGVTFIERVPSPSATSSLSQQDRISRDGTAVLPPITTLDDTDVGEEMEEGIDDDSGSSNNGNGRHHPRQSADETLGLNS